MIQAAEAIETVDPIQAVRFWPAERRALRGRSDIRVSAWAEKYREITRGSAQGRWTNSRTPYLVEPMDTWMEPWVRRVMMCFAPQTGKTQTAFNCLMYAVDVDPGPAMYIMPDENTAKRIIQRQIWPALRATKRVATLLSPKSHTLLIQFLNGMDLMLAWASSAAMLASESVRYMFYDEPGKYPSFVGKEADPFSLGEVRLNAYPHTSKEMFYSTPALDGDEFDKLLRNEADETRRYYAVCPICDHPQIMRFRNMHWGETRDPGLVMRKRLGRYSCEKCKFDWDDYRRDEAVRRGFWKADKPVERAQAVAFGPLPSWYSPFVSLSKPAAAFLRGQIDPKKNYAFVTQHKCQAWKDVIEPKQESEVLKRHRCQYPEGIVPPEALALTCGLDMQKIGFWFVVRAWARDLTNWLISYGYISTWTDVERLIYGMRYEVDGTDRSMGIWRAALDTGGGETEEAEWTRTEEAYQWLRKQAGRGVIFGVKGASRPQLRRVVPKVIDKMARGNRKIPGGLELRFLDTAAFKDLIHWRMTREKKDSQRFWLHAETGHDYVRQLLAEEKQKDRRGRVKWVRKGRANHLLDCEVYAAACADSEWSPSLSYLAKRADREKPADKPKTPPPAKAPDARRALPGWFQRR